MGESGPGLRAKIDFCPGSGCQFLVSRDEIGMQVGFKNVTDLQPVLFGRFQVKVYVTLRIHYYGFTLRPEHIRSMGQTAQIKLFKVHRSDPFPSEFAALENRATNHNPWNQRSTHSRGNWWCEATWNVFHIALS